MAAVLREHVRDFPGIVGARPDRCTGCAWEGTDWRRGGDEHMDHQAEVIVETLFRGGDDRG